MLTFLTGGARSGKSALAVRAAGRLGDAVVFIATARPEGDEEWQHRIARHRAERPSSWTTVEEQLDVAGAIGRCPPDVPLIVDCLTLWVANALEAGEEEEAVIARAEKAAAVAAGRPGPTFVVSNEVGSSIVPFDIEVRRYRDLLGRVNIVWAAAADQAWLVVAGRVLPLADIGDAGG